MATLSSPQRDANRHDHESQPISSAPDISSEPQINGIATQHNAISEFAYPPISSGEKVVFDSQPLPADPTPPTSAEEIVPPSKDGPEPSAEIDIAKPDVTVSIEATSIPEDSVPPVAGTLEQAIPDTSTPVIAQTQTVIQDSGISEAVVENDTVVEAVPSPPTAVVDEAPVVPNEEVAAVLPTTETTTSELPITVETTTFVETESTPSPQVATQSIIQTTEPAVDVIPPSGAGLIVEDQEMTDAVPVSGKVARERDEDEDEAPDAKRAKTETETLLEAPAEGPVVDTSNITAVAEIQSPTALSAPLNVDFGSEMTEPQRLALLEAMKNLKKNKAAVPFSKPVDAVALGIPQYYDIIQEPMDLSTMETKLKNKTYASVQQYIDDFDTMIGNAIKFNGEGHAVVHSGRNLQAQFRKGLEDRVPRAGEASRAPPPKKQALTLATTTRENKRRQSQPSAVVQTPSTATNETFAVGEYGVPQIRRQSSTQDGRPKREIHKPPSKDLPYSMVRQRKKKHQPELKFCDHVLDVMRSPKFANLAHPFLQPVDAVALNIPEYNSIIKKPMDLGTLTSKQANNLYENAKEFRDDFKLIFSNCKLFNPAGNPVREMGEKYEKAFDKLWATKDEWIANHAQSSGPHSPAVDSDDEEDDDDDEEEDNTQEQIQKLNEQIAILSAQAQSLIHSSTKKTKGKATGTKKGVKSGKASGTGKSGRKSGSLGGGSMVARTEKKAPKPKPAKFRTVTNKEKQEISEKISNLPTDQIAKAADWIKDGLRADGKHDLAARAEDDLEFDIDQINNEVLGKLLNLCRKFYPKDDEEDDSDSKSRNPAISKSKKSKPMSKFEQEQQINALRDKLSTFHGQQSSASPDMPIKRHDSDDEESDSASESEEE